MDFKIILAIFFVILVAVFFLNRQNSLKSELSTFNASMDANDFSLINVSSSQNATTILAQKSSEFIRIKVFSNNAEIRNETFSSIDNLFKPVFMISSYGVPAQTVVVPPQEIFPTNGTIQINGKKELYYLLYADVNLAYDTTSLKDSQYRVFVTFSSCGSKLFELEFFQPKDTFLQQKVLSLAESFKC